MSENLSVLVVDDNLSMAESLRDVLELKDFIAYGVNSGADALAILREHPVDILLILLLRAAGRVYKKDQAVNQAD
jgi:CheY-like chemotaxis protein